MPEHAEPSPLDTAEFDLAELQARLELGRLSYQTTESGSRLEVAHALTPEPDRRQGGSSNTSPERDRRMFRPIQLPTLFPEQGPILMLIVGGFASEVSLRRDMPFWGDDEGGSYLLWMAMAQAGLIHRADRDFALGRGGFWDDEPPRTLGVAMTYAGFQRYGESVSFEKAILPWNTNRLQTLTQACWERSMGRLKVVTIGEAAKILMCATAYGLPGIPVLSLPAPSPEVLSQRVGNDTTAQHWMDWATDLLMVGRP